MSYGFEVYNTNGEIVADTTSYPLVVVASGTGTANASGVVTINYSNTTVLPEVFVQTPGSSAWVAVSSRTTTSTTLVIYSNGTASNNCNPVNGATINYRIAVPSRYAPAGVGDWGMQLLDASGNITFDSRHDLAKINSGVTVNTSVLTSGAPTSLVSVQTALPSGVTTSNWFSVTRVYTGAAGYSQYAPGTPPTSFLYHLAIRLNSTFVQVLARVLSSSIPASGGNWIPNIGVMFLSS